MVNDPIADMLTRIRNAQAAGLSKTAMPASKMKAAVAELLKQHGFVLDYSLESDPKPTLVVTLANDEESAKLTGLARISKPGRRVYYAAGDIPSVRSGRGLVIMSTSKGLLSGKDAKQQGLGGELICKVW